MTAGLSIVKARAILIRSNLTPGITRRPGRLQVDDRQRFGGRVHAVVGLQSKNHGTMFWSGITK
jgi:hypothetical protein